MGRKKVDGRKTRYRNKILGIIRNNEPVSRFDVKKISSYSMTTTLSMIDEMLADGYIVESGVGESSGGRRPTWLKINPAGGYFLGVDFNANYVYSAIIDLGGDIIYTDTIKVPNDLNTTTSILLLIKESIRKMLSTLDADARIFGIGLGIPGYVDVQKGITLDYAFIRDWSNVHLREEMEKEFRPEIFVENNVNGMALAYKWIENGGLCGTLALLSVRTGVRLSAVVRNHLIRGAGNAAGEIDHIKLSGSDRLCSCGKRGCVVSEASNSAILSKVMEGLLAGRYQAVADYIGNDLSKLNMDALIQLYMDGDEEVRGLVIETAGYISEVLALIIALYNPEKLVISTDFIESGNEFLEMIKNNLKNLSNSHHLQPLSVEYAKYGAYIGAIGAACLVMQKTIFFTDLIE